jgi:hypothetical protein
MRHNHSGYGWGIAILGVSLDILGRGFTDGIKVGAFAVCIAISIAIFIEGTEYVIHRRAEKNRRAHANNVRKAFAHVEYARHNREKIRARLAQIARQ